MTDRLTGIKRRVARLSSDELNQLERYVKDRAKKVWQREWAAKCEAAWADMKALDLQPGDLLFNNQAGFAIGPTWQAGDCGAVYAVQIKKRTVWVETEYGWIGITPALWLRHDVGPNFPTRFVSEHERRMGTGLAKVFSEAAGQ